MPSTKEQPTIEKPISFKNEIDAISRKIKSEIIRKTAWLMFNLAKEIKESGNYYDSIVSDDASGRLVSLFLKKVLDGLRDPNKPSLNLRFIAGGLWASDEKLENIKEFLKKNKEKLGKVLLVTEYIYTGETLAHLIDIFQALDIEVDAASLSVSPDNINMAEIIIKTKVENFYYGDLSTVGGDLMHGAYDNTGVKKDKDDPSPFPYRAKEKAGNKALLQQSINQAREDLDLLAKKTVELLIR